MAYRDKCTIISRNLFTAIELFETILSAKSKIFLFPRFISIVFALFLSSLLQNAAIADTNVGGNITTNTTWTLAGSPYIATKDIYVSGSGAPVLTIELGVTVKFNQN